MRRLALLASALAGFALAVVPALADNQSVGTSGSSFTPAKVAVKPGEKVTISNTGMGFHDVRWVDGAPGYTPANTTGWSHERTFTTAGEFVFYCSVHGSPGGGMRGTVYVNEAGTVPGGGGGGGTTTTSTTPPPGGTTTTSTTPPPPPPPPPGGTTSTSTPPPPPGSDTTAPRVSGARSSASRRGVTVRLTLSEPATITLRVFRGARRVARRTFEADDGSVTLRVRRALRRGRYSLRLALVDAAGNRSTRSLSARVR